MTFETDTRPPPSPPIDAVEVTMPPTGSPEVARVVRWLKSPGAPVVLDEAICLVAWEEITAEVGSPSPGVLRDAILQAGQPVRVGASLAVLDLAELTSSISPPGG
jgi:pyruvate/2-oxoglutarate dehydrogenase complex dihydrolipoamide acyltransferase (E2) component